MPAAREPKENTLAYDSYCRAYRALKEELEASRDDPARKAPTAKAIADAAALVKVALGKRRRRVVGDAVITIDRLGTVHVVRFVPKQRDMAPYLIRSWSPVA